MERRDNLRSLSYGGRDPLDRARSHVTDGEDGAPARFQRFAVSGRVGARQHETLRIQSHARPGEPIGVGICPNEQKEVSQLPPVL